MQQQKKRGARTIASMAGEHKKSGHFNLFPLFDFVTGLNELPRIGKKERTKYAIKVGEILDCAGVRDDCGGWYVWGRFNDAAWWESLYVGMTTKGKTSRLRTRLYDELREESAAIFATVYGRDAVLSAARKQYRIWQHNKKNKKRVDYFKDGRVVQRRLRKTGTHYIIWVAAGRRDNISRIESVLINLYRPAFNSKRPKVSKEMINNPHVKEVDGEIQKQIGKMRHKFKI